MTMLERVARALFLREMQPFIDNGSATVTTFEECKEEFPEVADRYLAEARAAIQAMREPDENMLEAIDKVEVLFQCAPKWNYARQYQAAIDAALSPTNEPLAEGVL